MWEVKGKDREREARLSRNTAVDDGGEEEGEEKGRKGERAGFALFITV